MKTLLKEIDNLRAIKKSELPTKGRRIRRSLYNVWIFLIFSLRMTTPVALFCEEESFLYRNKQSKNNNNENT